MKEITVLVLIFSGVFNSLVCSKFMLKKMVNCDWNKHLMARCNLTVKTVDGEDYIDGTVIVDDPIDNNIKTNVSVQMLTGRKYVHLFYINERKSCEALYKYLGEFVYDLQRQAQIIPGICPIPKGKFALHNARLNYEKLVTMRNFPFGNLRFLATAYYRNNDFYSCAVADVENRL